MLALARLGLPTPYPEGAVSAWASTKEPHKDIQTSALMGQVTPTEGMAPRTTAGGVVSAVAKVSAVVEVSVLAVVSAWAGVSVVAGAGDGWLPSDNPKVTAKSNKGRKAKEGEMLPPYGYWRPWDSE